MFGATILVPMLVNAGAGEEVSFRHFICIRLGTLIYIICQKERVHLFRKFICFYSPMIVGFASAGKAGVFTAIVVVGLIMYYFVLIKFGKSG